MPAFTSPLTLIAVPEAPHRTPLTYHVCCMRVSPESSWDCTSLWTGLVLKNSCQQPGPNGVGVVTSLMQSRSGVLPDFCSDFGGNT